MDTKFQNLGVSTGVCNPAYTSTDKWLIAIFVGLLFIVFSSPVLHGRGEYSLPTISILLPAAIFALTIRLIIT